MRLASRCVWRCGADAWAAGGVWARQANTKQVEGGDGLPAHAETLAAGACTNHHGQQTSFLLSPAVCAALYRGHRPSLHGSLCPSFPLTRSPSPCLLLQFRNEGIDLTHNPEFTTCEFYQARVGHCVPLFSIEILFLYRTCISIHASCARCA